MTVAAQYGTVGDIEILWVLIATFGLGFALWNYRDAVKDCRALKEIETINGRMLLARAQKWQDGIRAIIHCIFILIGALAMMIPETGSTDTSSPAFWIGVSVRWGLIFGAILLVVQSVIARVVRSKVIDLARHDIATKAAEDKARAEGDRRKDA